MDGKRSPKNRFYRALRLSRLFGLGNECIVNLARNIKRRCAVPLILVSTLYPSVALTNEIQASRDFIIDDVKITSQQDGSRLLDATVFNLGPADGVLEVHDSSGTIVGLPILILGNRPLPDSLYAIVVQNQLNVVNSLTSDYPLLDKRNPSQSHASAVSSVSIPAGGSVRITKASDFAIAFNLFGLVADGVGFVPVEGNKIDQRLINDVVKEIVSKFLTGFKLRVLAHDLGPNDIPKFAAEIAFNLSTNVLKPENLDGRTVLGKMVKKYAVDFEPYTKGLELVALEGWGFNWMNAMVNLEAAYINDSTIAIDLGRSQLLPDSNSNQMDCGIEGTLKSTSYDTATKLEFMNASVIEIKTFWINYEGHRVYYNSLPPGKSYVQQTYVTHPWVITNRDGKCIAIFLPRMAAQRAIVQ